MMNSFGGETLDSYTNLKPSCKEEQAPFTRNSKVSLKHQTLLETTTNHKKIKLVWNIVIY